MISKWPFWLLISLLLFLAGATPLAQSPSSVSLYSIWIRLSLRGMNQGEIESLMRNMAPKNIGEVKKRLRKTVISNLLAKKIPELFLASRDSDDLKSVLISIETELRFAGLQNDEDIKQIIKNKLGIPLNRL
ncbi:MAG: hypothetical protein V3S64_13470 [bacterium]